MSVCSIIGPTTFAVGKAIPAHVRDPNDVVAVSDASASAVCAYTTTERDRLYTRRELSSIERTYGSGHRELIAVAHGLDDLGDGLVLHLHAVYHGDGRPHLRHGAGLARGLPGAYQHGRGPLHAAREPPASVVI